MGSIYNYKPVKKASDLPQGQHFAALVFSSIQTPGYDPGDPPGSADIVDYKAFSSKKEMEGWVIAQETSRGTRETYQIVEVVPRAVKLNATVSIQ